jgi:transcriptional regulator GlxA family with amidase domain
MARDERKVNTIAFVTYPGLTLLDLVGPLSAFYGLDWPQVRPEARWQTVSVGERVAVIDTDTPMRLIPEKTFDDVPHPFGIIVPGGGEAALEAMANDAIVDYVRTAAETAEVVGSVSTGAFILAAAGLLDGRQATTHPAFGELLKKLGANYVRRNWVEDGRFISAAGVSGGIDMALYLLARLKNKPIAKRTQTVIEYDPDPPFGGIEQNGGADGNGLATTVVEHWAELERALADRPHLHQKLFG